MRRRGKPAWGMSRSTVRFVIAWSPLVFARDHGIMTRRACCTHKDCTHAVKKRWKTRRLRRSRFCGSAIGENNRLILRRSAFLPPRGYEAASRDPLVVFPIRLGRPVRSLRMSFKIPPASFFTREGESPPIERGQYHPCRTSRAADVDLHQRLRRCGGRSKIGKRDASFEMGGPRG